jgi:hypothetical protein
VQVLVSEASVLQLVLAFGACLGMGEMKKCIRNNNNFKLEKEEEEEEEEEEQEEEEEEEEEEGEGEEKVNSPIRLIPTPLSCAV